MPGAPPAPGALGIDIIGGELLAGVLEALEPLPPEPPQPEIAHTARPITTSDKRFIAHPLFTNVTAMHADQEGSTQIGNHRLPCMKGIMALWQGRVEQ
jgi:hypothetical protein